MGEKQVRNAVLLVHGLTDTEEIFRDMKSWLAGRGFEVHSLNLVPNNGDAGLDQLAAQVAGYIDSRFTPGQFIDIVGFSMGGLVARYYLQRLGGLKRAKRLITISSPHKGTWTAFLRGNPGARQMRPGSSFLKDLDRDAAILDHIPVTSIWTPFDLMILPAASCIFRQERSIRLNVAAHPLMVRDRRVFNLVHELLSGEATSPAATSTRKEPAPPAPR